MWREILIDDNIGLQKVVDIYYSNAIVGCSEMSAENIQHILNTKTNAHCYLFDDGVMKIYAIYKYDAEYDSMVVFQIAMDSYNLDKIMNDSILSEKRWSKCIELTSIILNRHGKKVMITKVPKRLLTETYKNIIMDNIITKYGANGIIATEFEHYWEYELM